LQFVIYQSKLFIKIIVLDVLCQSV